MHMRSTLLDIHLMSLLVRILGPAAKLLHTHGRTYVHTELLVTIFPGLAYGRTAGDN